MKSKKQLLVINKDGWSENEIGGWLVGYFMFRFRQDSTKRPKERKSKGVRDPCCLEFGK
jgi:hypothetical protein